MPREPFEFAGGCQRTGEEVSCNHRGVGDAAFGTTFHGDSGTVKIPDRGHVVSDR